MLDHFKCRNAPYPRDNIQRFPVPDNLMHWEAAYPKYDPIKYTSKGVHGQPWADVELDEEISKTMNWNGIEETIKVDRRSFLKEYDVISGFPRNPVGRTGVIGRGCLGRWGPNHAADPIVTRWKRSGDKIVVDPGTNKKILQFVAIRRRDSGEWAIPGGMVDPGEMVTQTLRREFGEEALNTMEAEEGKKKDIEKNIGELFDKGKEIYSGYVDDPRNTDNAWMETVAYNYHDDNGTSVGLFDLHAGDDAVGAQWMDISGKLMLYASHAYMIKRVVGIHDAHW